MAHSKPLVRFMIVAVTLPAPQKTYKIVSIMGVTITNYDCDVIIIVVTQGLSVVNLEGFKAGLFHRFSWRG